MSEERPEAGSPADWHQKAADVAAGIIKGNVRQPDIDVLREAMTKRSANDGVRRAIR